MTAPTLTTLDGVPDMTTLPEAPVSPAPIASEHAEMWALIQRAQAGDREAFAAIYRHHEDVIYKYVYYRTKGNHDLAAEVSSEVWLRAFRRIGSFTYTGREIQAWLVTIARNYLFDIFKSDRNKRESVTDEIYDAMAIADCDRLVDPVHVAARTELRSALREAMGHLNAHQRRCIELRFFDGKSTAESAVELGLTEGAVKALQWRATQSLARLLPEHYADFLRS